MNPIRLSPFVAALAALSPAFAQSVTLPASAVGAEGHQSVGLPFGAPGFRTQILIEATTIAPNGAVLTGLRFRTDRTSLPLAATTVPNVTVTVSESTQPFGAFSSTFAQNVTGVGTVVFQGTVALPGYPEAFAGPLPWDIVVPFSQPFPFSVTTGNLLIDIVGNNPGGAFPSYWLDGAEAGGAATTFGRGGDNATFDDLNLLVATGVSLEPHLLTIGNTIDFVSTLSFMQPPGVLAMSLNALPLPIDLAPIGAPTNTLYVDPQVLVPLTWTQSFIGWYSTTSLPVPLDPLLLGTMVYAQGAILEPTSNALGIVFGGAVEVRIGDPVDLLPMRQVDANDPNAAAGTIVDFGFGSGRYGATPIVLEGTFF